jgi:hypothetical protein
MIAEQDAKPELAIIWVCSFAERQALDWYDGVHAPGAKAVQVQRDELEAQLVQSL